MRLLCKNLIATVVLTGALIAQAVGPSVIWAKGGLELPAVGTLVTATPAYDALMLKGIRIYPDDPFRFDFMVRPGQEVLSEVDQAAALTRLMRYFLAALTVPEEDLWVNLSPYEDDRIIPSALGQTEMGRDLLAQDYILKQLTASFIHPEGVVGAEFWEQVYAQAQATYGTTDIPIETFHKVWILPDIAEVYEQQTAVYVTKSRLKVMLEEDYKAYEACQLEARCEDEEIKASYINGDEKTFVPTDIMRTVVIPAIEKEVNEGQHFAPLRQVYHALILGMWFKRHLKDSLIGQYYADQNKVFGIDLAGEGSTQYIYDQYVDAFRQGVYDFIEEDYDPSTDQIIPRKYFSGGVQIFGALSKAYVSSAIDHVAAKEELSVVQSLMKKKKKTAQMNVEHPGDFIGPYAVLSELMVDMDKQQIVFKGRHVRRQQIEEIVLPLKAVKLHPNQLYENMRSFLNEGEKHPLFNKIIQRLEQENLDIYILENNSYGIEYIGKKDVMAIHEPFFNNRLIQLLVMGMVMGDAGELKSQDVLAEVTNKSWYEQHMVDKSSERAHLYYALRSYLMEKYPTESQHLTNAIQGRLSVDAVDKALVQENLSSWSNRLRYEFEQWRYLLKPEQEQVLLDGLKQIYQRYPSVESAKESLNFEDKDFVLEGIEEESLVEEVFIFMDSQTRRLVPPIEQDKFLRTFVGDVLEKRPDIQMTLFKKVLDETIKGNMPETSQRVFGSILANLVRRILSTSDENMVEMTNVLWNYAEEILVIENNSVEHELIKLIPRYNNLFEIYKDVPSKVSLKAGFLDSIETIMDDGDRSYLEKLHTRAFQRQAILFNLLNHMVVQDQKDHIINFLLHKIENKYDAQTLMVINALREIWQERWGNYLEPYINHISDMFANEIPGSVNSKNLEETLRGVMRFATKPSEFRHFMQVEEVILSEEAEKLVLLNQEIEQFQARIDNKPAYYDQDMLKVYESSYADLSIKVDGQMRALVMMSRTLEYKRLKGAYVGMPAEEIFAYEELENQIFEILQRMALHQEVGEVVRVQAQSHLEYFIGQGHEGAFRLVLDQVEGLKDGREIRQSIEKIGASNRVGVLLKQDIKNYLASSYVQENHRLGYLVLLRFRQQAKALKMIVHDDSIDLHFRLYALSQYGTRQELKNEDFIKEIFDNGQKANRFFQDVKKWLMGLKGDRVVVRQLIEDTFLQNQEAKVYAMANVVMWQTKLQIINNKTNALTETLFDMAQLHINKLYDNANNSMLLGGKLFEKADYSFEYFMFVLTHEFGHNILIKQYRYLNYALKEGVVHENVADYLGEWMLSFLGYDINDMKNNVRYSWHFEQAVNKYFYSNEVHNGARALRQMMEFLFEVSGKDGNALDHHKVVERILRSIFYVILEKEEGQRELSETMALVVKHFAQDNYLSSDRLMQIYRDSQNEQNATIGPLSAQVVAPLSNSNRLYDAFNEGVSSPAAGSPATEVGGINLRPQMMNLQTTGQAQAFHLSESVDGRNVDFDGLVPEILDKVMIHNPREFLQLP